MDPITAIALGAAAKGVVDHVRNSQTCQICGSFDFGGNARRYSCCGKVQCYKCWGKNVGELRPCAACGRSKGDIL